MISMAFTAIVKANTYNSKRVIKGLVWFVVYYLTTNLITLLVIMTIFAISGNWGELFATQLSQKALITILIVGLILYVTFSIVYYFFCYKLFRKGVNVD